MSDEATPEAPQPSGTELLRAEMRAGFQTVGIHAAEGNSTRGREQPYFRSAIQMSASARTAPQ